MYDLFMLRCLIFVLTAAMVLGCETTPLIWIPRSQSADPLYRFVKSGKAGYIDGTGRVVIPPKLNAYGNSGAEFHDGLLEIAASDGRYMDRTGRVVIDKDLYRGWDFSEGLAVAMRKGENLWGYIDSSGEFAISPRFETYPNGYVYPFSDGLAMIQVRGNFGFIDHSGGFVIKPQFPDAVSFHDGMARVVTQGPCIYFPDGGCGFANPQFVGGQQGGDSASCKFTFIDKSGRVITQDRFDYARDFSEGLAPVRIGKVWGFIDKTGAVAVAPNFEDARSFSAGLSRIKEHGLYGYADRSGGIKISPKYKYAEDFSEGLAVVGDGLGRYWYVDVLGERPIPEEFAAASLFFKGLAHVKLLSRQARNSGATFAYIDPTGRRVFTY